MFVPRCSRSRQSLLQALLALCVSLSSILEAQCQATTQTQNPQPALTGPVELQAPLYHSESGEPPLKIRLYGWLDGGFVYSKDGAGRLIEAPTPDRFGDQVMLNAAWVGADRPTTNALSWGLRADFYAGSDPALLRSQNYFGPDDLRWGTEVRQAFVKVHIPQVGMDGMDIAAGRINFPTGTETVIAPVQLLYSRSYFWIHAETSGTALVGTLHPTSRIALTLGPTFGYGSYFILRGRAPNYIAHLEYELPTQHETKFVVGTWTGPQPIVATAGHIGSWQTLSEVQLHRQWTQRFRQIYQASYISDPKDPANGFHNSAVVGAYLMNTITLNRKSSMNARLEYFGDPHGARTASPGLYGEATLGISVHPNEWFEWRPEIRGDFSDHPAFGPYASTLHHKNQLTVGFELLFKRRLF